MANIEGMTRTVATVPTRMRRRDFPPHPDLTKTVYGHEPLGALTKLALEIAAKFFQGINIITRQYVLKKNRQSPVKPR